MARSVFIEYFIKSNTMKKNVYTPQLLDLYARCWAKPHSPHGSFGYYRALNETARRNKSLAATRSTMPVLTIGSESSMGK